MSSAAHLPQPPATASRPSFEAVYAQNFAYVDRTLKRMGIHWAEVDDLVQEVFLVVHRRLDDYVPTRPMKPWLFGIAFRVASQHRRKASADSSAMTSEVADPTPDAEAHIEGAQARQLVLEALQAVDLEQRAVLILADIDEQPIPVVAESLGIPLNTAYSRLRVARQRFAAAVRRLQTLRGC